MIPQQVLLCLQRSAGMKEITSNILVGTLKCG